jgi:hypothetical protein
MYMARNEPAFATDGQNAHLDLPGPTDFLTTQLDMILIHATPSSAHGGLCLSNNRDRRQESSEQVVLPSCQRKLASRIGLTADAFSRPGFRLSPE